MIRSTIATLIAALIFFASVTTVYAHVKVEPSEAIAGKNQIFTITVPTEKDIPTSSIALTIPEGVTNVTPYAKAGWEVIITETQIMWTGGSILRDLKDEFRFSAKVNTITEKLIWKAYQSYADGSVVSWDQEPGSVGEHGDESTPYSQTAVTPVNATEPLEITNATLALTLILSITALVFSTAAVYKAYKIKHIE
jgi:uncharacterized protein YcnI